MALPTPSRESKLIYKKTVVSPYALGSMFWVKGLESG